MRSSTSTLFLILLIAPLVICYWSNLGYPDLRGPSVHKCGITPSSGELLYICDPDHILNSSQSRYLNDRLHAVAIGTPCHCQRRSQCSSGDDLRSEFHGFVVSIAIASNLQMTIHNPSEEQLNERAESFCRSLEGRWALGDCGNSVIVFVWEHYRKVVIWPARLAERYVSAEERRRIVAANSGLVQNGQWFEALNKIIGDLYQELKGEPEGKFDTGTISLIIAVGVACFLTFIITCCVCAFRCCGNLKPANGGEHDRKCRRGKGNLLRMQVVRRGSQLRRSFSRSPKFPTREVMSNGGFYMDGQTTMV